ncbi:MAG: hypothetical protein LCH90_23185 [Proteobacteria bacterium]|nr:hypothetical protein [Pseudomonadota bacterium]
MMQQVGLFESGDSSVPHLLARKTDPDTSKFAAASVNEFSRVHRNMILDALRKFGPMTVDQIASRTPLMSQQINKRTVELKRDGHIRVKKDEQGNDVTRDSLSGRPERVWEAV